MSRSDRWKARTLGIALLLFPAIIAPTLARADRYFVAPVSGTSVSENDRRTVEELVKAYLARRGQTVVSDEQASDFVLRGKLLQLGSSLILSMEKRAEGSPSPQPRYSAQMRAERIEELDRVTERVTGALIDEVPVEKNATLAQVTESESRANRLRIEAVGHRFIAFGPFGSRNLGTNELLLGVSAAYAWQVNPFWGLGVFFDLATTPADIGQAIFLGAGLRGSYFFSDRDAAPFVQASAGYGFADGAGAAEKSTAGFLGGLGLGYRFFRTSSVNLEVAAKYHLLFSENGEGMPGAYGVQLGLYF